MAETPEEVARQVVREGGGCEHMNTCDCMEQFVASALRAQYVAGLEAALAAYEATAHDPCDHVRNAIRELAEQAKEGK